MNYYQNQMDILNQAIGSEVEDTNGVVWTVYDFNIRRIYDPLVLLWNRDTYEQKYISKDEFLTYSSVSSK